MSDQQFLHNQYDHPIVQTSLIPRSRLLRLRFLGRVDQPDREAYIYTHGDFATARLFHSDSLERCNDTKIKWLHALLLGVCIASHESHLSFAVESKDSNSTMKLVVNFVLGWKVVDCKKFLNDVCLRLIGPEQPFRKRTFDQWATSFLKQRIGSVCGALEHADLINGTAMGWNAWQDSWESWLLPLGIEPMILSYDASDDVPEEVSIAIRREVAYDSELKAQTILVEKEYQVLDMPESISAMPTAHISKPEICDSDNKERYSIPMQCGTDTITGQNTVSNQRHWVLRLLTLPIAVSAYVLLLIPTPLVVFILWQWDRLCSDTANGYRMFSLPGLILALLYRLILLPFSTLRYLWPTTHYCGNQVWNAQSFICSWNIVNYHLSLGIHITSLYILFRWADTVLSLAHTPTRYVGRYNFYRCEDDYRLPRTWTRRRTHQEFSQAGIRHHQDSHRIGALILVLFFWTSIILITQYLAI